MWTEQRNKFKILVKSQVMKKILMMKFIYRDILSTNKVKLLNIILDLIRKTNKYKSFSHKLHRSIFLLRFVRISLKSITKKVFLLQNQTRKEWLLKNNKAKNPFLRSESNRKVFYVKIVINNHNSKDKKCSIQLNFLRKLFKLTIWDVILGRQWMRTLFTKNKSTSKKVFLTVYKFKLDW